MQIEKCPSDSLALPNLPPTEFEFEVALVNNVNQQIYQGFIRVYAFISHVVYIVYRTDSDTKSKKWFTFDSCR